MATDQAVKREDSLCHRICCQRCKFISALEVSVVTFMSARDHFKVHFTGVTKN